MSVYVGYTEKQKVIPFFQNSTLVVQTFAYFTLKIQQYNALGNGISCTAA